jgi:hypothetical protein
MDPKKLPMEEMRLTAETLATAILEENDEAVYLVLENIVDRYTNLRFEWLYQVRHTELGHTIGIYCALNGGKPTLDYHTPYYKLEEFRSVVHMGAMLLRDIVYMIDKANMEMANLYYYKDKENFDLLEQALFVELVEDVHGD